MKTRTIVLLLLCAAACAAAQEYESSLDEITVTATRVEERESEVASAVTVVTDEEMDAREVHTIVDAVSAVAGTTVSDYGAAGARQTVTIRGSTSSQVLVLVDGVRVSSSMSGSTDLSTIPAGSIERIEVLRAGASALYGSDAVGGVINIITRKKQAPLTVTVENASFIPSDCVTGYGVGKTENGPQWMSLVDSQKVSFSMAPSIGDVLLRFSGGFSRAANEYTFIDSSDEVRLRQNAGLLAGNAALGVNLPLLGGTLEGDFSGAYKENGVPGSLGSPTLYATQADTRATAVARFTTERFLADALDLEAAIHAEYAEVAYADAETPDNDSDSRLYTAGLELQQSARASDALVFVYGMSTAYDRGLSTEFGTPERLAAGAFLSPEITIGAVTLSPAVRCDFYSDYHPGAIGGSLGAAWRLSDADTVKADISRSYRVPSFEDLYWPSGAGVEGNPDLIPETGYSAEAGYERSGENRSYSVFAFARYVRDVILWQAGSDGIWRPSNFGAAFYPGIEQELKLRFLEGYTASVSHTFLYSYTLDEGMSLADNKRLPMTPVHSVNATLGFTGDDVSWSVTGRYQSLRYLMIANAAYLPEVFVLDAVMKKNVARGWVAYLAVDNLFGARYQSVSGYPMPDTSIRLGLTASF